MSTTDSKNANVTTIQGRVFAGLLAVFGAMPWWLNRLSGVAMGWLFVLLPNRSKRNAQRNIELCFPELDAADQRQLVRRHLVETGKAWVELGHVWRRPLSRVAELIDEVENEDIYLDAIKAGNGVLVAVPHIGAWEVFSYYLASKVRTIALYREPKDPGIDRVINNGRSRLGSVPVKAGARGVREVVRSLRAGDAVAILPDQQPKQGQGEFAPFCRIQALTMVLLSKLAAKTGAAVVFGAVIRKPGRQGFTLTFRAADPIVSGADTQASVAAINVAVEEIMRLAPAQYQWGYKRFSIRPEGEPPLY